MSSSTLIPHPHSTIPVKDRAVAQVFIDPSLEEFFRRTLTAGTKGVMSALGATFYTKLHAAWLAEGWPTQYELENESRLIELLTRLNFDKPNTGTAVSNLTKPKRKRAVASTP